MVTEISSARRAEIKSKSVKGLPNAVTGKPDTVKNAIFDPVDIVVGEVNKIVGETNDSIADCKNNISENTKLIEKNKTGIETNKVNIEKNKADIDKNKAEIDKILHFADEHKFATEIVFDMSSSSSSLNHGFPGGLYKGNTMSDLNLSKYRYLIIDYQYDRTLTMFLDLTEKNYSNGFYINSMAGVVELRKEFATLAFEVIVDLKKTYIKLNNALRSASYSAPSNLVTDENARISKVTGII